MTTKALLKIYGNPFEDAEGFKKKHMTMWDIPKDINDAIRPLPNILYCNKAMVQPLEKVFRGLIEKGLHKEIKTFDGCFNIRKQRGSAAISKHSWAVAIDLNAHDNPFVKVQGNREELRKKVVKWSEPFLDVWRAEFICGADWNTLLDGMHFELREI